MINLKVVSDKNAIAAEALNMAHQLVEKQSDELFSIMLAGGSTPASFHRALAAADWPWWRTTVLFGDERCVPPTHKDSNYASAHESLLKDVSPAAVLRMTGEAPSSSAAADHYNNLLQGLPGKKANLVFVGMGDDGHTVSLFPDRAEVKDRDVIAVPQPPHASHSRITVTEAFLARCDQVVVLISGAGKADRLEEVVKGNNHGPLSQVLRYRKNKPTVLLVDAAAARNLTSGEIEI